MSNVSRPWRAAPWHVGLRLVTRGLLHRGLRRWKARLARLWWPFEAGNDLGALATSDPRRAYPHYVPERAANELLIEIQEIQRSVRRQRLVIVLARTLWLALAAALLALLARYVVTVSVFASLIAAAVVLALGYLYHRTHPTSVWATGRLVDRHWHLAEQVTTALELATTPAPPRLAARQSVAALAQLRASTTGRRPRVQVPWADLQVLASLAILVLGLAVTTGSAERLAPPTNLIPLDALSPSTPTDDLGLLDSELQPLQGMDEYALAQAMNGLQTDPSDALMTGLDGADSEALRKAAELSNRSASDLEHLADALQDASVTSQAAQEIRAGDYQAAAQQMSDLAKSVDKLSPEARADLAKRLSEAAANIQQSDPELARRLEQAAKAVASRSDRAAAQGLDDVSQAIQDTGKNVLSQQSLADALSRAGDQSQSLNDDGPAQGQAAAKGAGGEQSALAADEAGQFGYGQSETALAVGMASSASPDGMTGGTGAGQGTGSEAEQYTPRLAPSENRIVTSVEQAPGPTAPRLGQTPPGSPEVISAGPGTTGPGRSVQSGQPITTGYDANRVPRGMRTVIEGYFRNYKVQ